MTVFTQSNEYLKFLVKTSFDHVCNISRDLSKNDFVENSLLAILSKYLEIARPTKIRSPKRKKQLSRLNVNHLCNAKFSI